MNKMYGGKNYYDDEYDNNNYDDDNEIMGGGVDDSVHDENTCGLTLCKAIVAIILIVMAFVLFFNAYAMKTQGLFTRLLIVLLGFIILCYGLNYLGVKLCL